MSTFMTGLKSVPYGMTENGAHTYTTTGSKCLDLFALGASMRNRSTSDCLSLFRNAYDEDPNTAFQLLWYIGDVRNGQGERRMFRECYKWLIQKHPKTAYKYLETIPLYKRWDDLIYIANIEENSWDKAIEIIKKELVEDVARMQEGKPISLLAKWLPSINASNSETKRLGRSIAHSLHVTYRTYRKTLSKLRNYLNIVETNLTKNNYNRIEYSKVPSKANLKYSKAFMRNDEDRYRNFIGNKSAKMNMSVSYPYEIVSKVKGKNFWHSSESNCLEDDVVNKMWANLPDYLNGNESNTICVVDTSGSMEGTPLDVACSLGLYFGERNRGPFKDCFISFSSRPQLIEFEHGAFADKVRDIYSKNLVENTNIQKVFELLLEIAKRPTTKKEDIPENVLIISDMEFDYAQEGDFESIFDKLKRDWDNAGFKMPHLIFHNVDARQNNIPIIDPTQKVSLISGMSPVIYKTLISGKSGVELMYETIAPYKGFTTID